MLLWSLIFLVFALVCASGGFYFLAATSSMIAKVLFFVFIVMSIGSFIAHLTKRR